MDLKDKFFPTRREGTLAKELARISQFSDEDLWGFIGQQYERSVATAAAVDVVDSPVDSPAMLLSWPLCVSSCLVVTFDLKSPVCCSLCDVSNG